MNTRKFTLALSALALAAASFAANAEIIFNNLGTAAPPATVGPHVVTAFSQEPQVAIPEYSNVVVVPGNPVAGTLGLTPGGMKLTVGTTWWGGNSNPWGHNYRGVVYYVQSDVATLALPLNTQAFYFYVQPNAGGTWQVTATTNSGTTSGPIAVTSWANEGAANGYAFYSTAGESIASITITAQPGSSGMAIGEFGIRSGPTFTTCAAEGFTGIKLTLCRQICEIPQSPARLSALIKTYVTAYREDPPCAR